MPYRLAMPHCRTVYIIADSSEFVKGFPRFFLPKRQNFSDCQGHGRKGDYRTAAEGADGPQKAGGLPGIGHRGRRAARQSTCGAVGLGYPGREMRVVCRRPDVETGRRQAAGGWRRFRQRGNRHAARLVWAVLAVKCGWSARGRVPGPAGSEAIGTRHGWVELPGSQNMGGLSGAWRRGRRAARQSARGAVGLGCPNCEMRVVRQASGTGAGGRRRNQHAARLVWVSGSQNADNLSGCGRSAGSRALGLAAGRQWSNLGVWRSWAWTVLAAKTRAEPGSLRHPRVPPVFYTRLRKSA